MPLLTAMGTGIGMAMGGGTQVPALHRPGQTGTSPTALGHSGVADGTPVSPGGFPSARQVHSPAPPPTYSPAPALAHLHDPGLHQASRFNQHAGAVEGRSSEGTLSSLGGAVASSSTEASPSHHHPMQSARDGPTSAGQEATGALHRSSSTDTAGHNHSVDEYAGVVFNPPTPSLSTAREGHGDDGGVILPTPALLDGGTPMSPSASTATPISPILSPPTVDGVLLESLWPLGAEIHLELIVQVQAAADTVSGSRSGPGKRANILFPVLRSDGAVQGAPSTTSSSSSAQAHDLWVALQDNGMDIPDDVVPVIAALLEIQRTAAFILSTTVVRPGFTLYLRPAPVAGQTGGQAVEQPERRSRLEPSSVVGHGTGGAVTGGGPGGGEELQSVISAAAEGP
jgi:hypothetical protein